MPYSMQTLLMEIVRGLFKNSKIIYWNRLECDIFPDEKKITVTEKECEKAFLDCNCIKMVQDLDFGVSVAVEMVSVRL